MLILLLDMLFDGTFYSIYYSIFDRIGLILLKINTNRTNINNLIYIKKLPKKRPDNY